MNGNVMSSFVEMEPELLKILVTEAEETVATGIEESEMPDRSFSIVDLWNIRRNSNSARNCFKG